MFRIFSFLLFSYSFLLAQPELPIVENFGFRDIQGDTHILYNYLNQDKFVVLEFYNEDHPATISSRPGMNALYSAFGDPGDQSMVLFSIDMDQTLENEGAFQTDNNIAYDVVRNVHLFSQFRWNKNEPMFIVICPDRIWKVRKGSIFDETQFIENMTVSCASLSPYSLDGKIFSFFGNTQYCEGATTASFYIQNYSQTAALTSAVITAEEGTNVRGSVTWTGLLSPYEVDTVLLPLENIAGFDLLTFRLDSINQNADTVPSNNSFNKLLREGRALKNTIFLEFTTDFNPNQNGYYIIDAFGDTSIASLPNSFPLPNTTYNIEINLTNLNTGCYEFFFFDTFGDGILSGETEDGTSLGSLVVLSDQGDTLLNNGRIERLRSRKFYKDAFLALEDQNAESWCYYVASERSVHSTEPIESIAVYSPDGRKVVSQLPQSSSVHLPQLLSGVYYLRVENKKGDVLSIPIYVR